MRTLRRRLISFGMILVLILSLLPTAPASAVENSSGICGDDLTWTLSEGVLTIEGTGDMYQYGDQKTPWASNASSITRVEVRYGVTSVCNYAFNRCTKLTTVTFADSVKSLGTRVCGNCSSLTSVELPAHLTFIPADAFINCRALPSIEIPNSVTSVGSDAFHDCDSLTKVVIPDSVNGVGAYTFYGCDNLKTVRLGIGVNGVRYEIFAGCPKLEAVNVDPANPHHSSINGVVYSKDHDILMFHPPMNGTSVTIPPTVQVIQSKAFYENYNGILGHVSMLKEIIFEGNAPTFGSDCFTFITATAYYPDNNDTWKSAELADYGGTITWAPYTGGASLIDIAGCDIRLAYEETPWTGNPNYPGVTVTYQGNVLKEGIHYSVAYDNTIEVGRGMVTITGRGAYTGKVVKYYTIRKGDQTLELSIPSTTIEIGYPGKITAIGTRGSLYITYASDHPEIATVDSKGTVTGIAPGKVTISVTSAGNEHYLPITETLQITVVPQATERYDINDCQIKMVTGNFSYTGYERKASFVISRGSTTLSPVFDFEVTCYDAIETGTATAVVTGIGNYTGSASFTYQILPAGQNVTATIFPEVIRIGETARITVDGIGTITYTSDSPDIASVDANGVVTGLAPGRAWIDVYASGDKNHNAARHAVRLEVEAAVAPELKSIADCSVSLKTIKYVYDGTEKCPEAAVVDGSKTLVEGTDYTIAYHDNVNAGYPTATVIGMGSYTGQSAPLTFEIRQAFQTVRISTLSPLVIRVGESAQIEATGIGRLMYYTSTANDSLEIGQYTGIVTGLAPGSVEVIVQAAGDSNHFVGDATISVQVVANESAPGPGDPDFPGFQELKTEMGPAVSILEQPVLKSATNSAAGTVTFTWNSLPGATEYDIYRKSGSGSWVKIATVLGEKTVSYQDTGLKSGTTCSYTVSASNGNSYANYNETGISVKVTR